MLIGLNSCGYKLAGFGNQIPPRIKTVAIPNFENKTSRDQIDQIITKAIKDEFIRRSSLDLSDRPDNADSLIEGMITRFDVTPVTFGADSSANLYRITITIDIRFLDIDTNEVIFEGKGLTFSENYDINYENFFSRETETLIKIADDFASSVVTTILENF